MSVTIDKVEIGSGNKPYIIAEMSGNHNNSLDRALQIVEEAAKVGVNALKLQTYTPDTITIDKKEKEFFIKDKGSIWKGKSLYELYQKAYTPWDWQRELIKKSYELGITCFSSPFDESAVDFLEEINVSAYKIASFENSHIPLIKKVAKTKKPILISTGTASLSEIAETVELLRHYGAKNFILLKCTSNYPASPANSNVLTIPHMKNLFKCEVGISDHTLGIGASIAAVAHGASVIEKHFTLDRGDGGVDSSFSLEPKEMSTLVKEAKRAWQSLGNISYGPTEEEVKSRAYRRSLYIVKDMKKNEILTNENLRVIRPGLGLSPKYYEILLGKRVNRKIRKGTPVDWHLIL